MKTRLRALIINLRVIYSDFDGINSKPFNEDQTKFTLTTKSIDYVLDVRGIAF